MENSFFEYRDTTGAITDSDSEIIDNSILGESFTAKKQTCNNKTAFVAESEESSTDGDVDNEASHQQIRHSILRRSNIGDAHIISNSDDEEASPEMLPKRRPPTRPKSITLNSPCIGKKNKRTTFMDSDMDNSIVLEHERLRKLACLKDTPLKIDDRRKSHQKSMDSDKKRSDEDTESNSDTESDDDEQRQQNSDVITANDSDRSLKINKLSIGKNRCRIIDSDEEVENNEKGEGNNNQTMVKSDEEVESNDKSLSKNCHRIIDSDEEIETNKNSVGKNRRRIIESDEEVENNEIGEEKGNSSDEIYEDDDEGPDEDQMLMSRATRMSIMGVIPKDNDSDDSDFIQSDESQRKSCGSVYKTPEKQVVLDNDTSTISCSPFSESLHDLSNQSQRNHNESIILLSDDNISKDKFIDLTNLEILKNDSKGLIVKRDFPIEGLKSKVLAVEDKENCDDDVTIVDSKPEIIALSSDDEDDAKVKSPITKDLPKIKKEESPPNQTPNATIARYLVPASYPNQVVYVKKHVKENELRKLEGLKEDLHNVRNILENMDVRTLPDGGLKIKQRLTALEAEVRRQGDKVANMVIEPDIPTAKDVAQDGFDSKPPNGLSWEDIQKASNAVQPRMFGSKAMATHMAERNLILERLRNLHESLASRPPETSQQPAPAAVRSALMPHQLHALAWLQWRETQRPCGGILADDMGLGKTITMISLVASGKENRIDDGDEEDDEDEQHGRTSTKLTRGGSLVVCPASLMQQWAAEVSKHCQAHALSVYLHHGAARAQQPHRLAVHDLVVTTYNILQRDKEKNVLMRVNWRRIILDEAHIVRNHKSVTSAAVTALHGKRRWCLTGTPVQNKDLDLFALLKFLRCTPFDDLTMWKKWIDNKSQGGQDRLSTLMRAILLRRTKLQLQQNGQLACLPERTTHQCEVQLAKNEMNVYQKVLVFSKTLFSQFLHQRAEKQADAEGLLSSGKDTAYDRMHKKMIALQGAKPVKSHQILVLLLRLRQVCCHCGLIAAMLDSEDQETIVEEDPAGQDLLAELKKLTLDDSRSVQNDSQVEGEEGPGAAESTSVTEAIRSVLSPNNPVFDLTRQSSKIQSVMDCLHKNVFINKDDKAVVVSQWTSVLKLVERELDRARIKSVTLSGSVKVTARPALIDAINNPASGVKVMLLSLCAGGVGLNLCGANHLLLLDPHWNPQLEEQAQDRIYRVGQKKPVHIYRFMCVETVEQSIRKLQQDKLQLAANVLTGAKNTNASKLTIEDLRMLFNMVQD